MNNVKRYFFTFRDKPLVFNLILSLITLSIISILLLVFFNPITSSATTQVQLAGIADQNFSGGTGMPRSPSLTPAGVTQDAVVPDKDLPVLTVRKSVAINPFLSIVGAISFAVDFSFFVLGLFALLGALAFFILHRRSGARKCAGGLCRIFSHPTRSYERTVDTANSAPSFSTHRKIHGYTQAAFIAAITALVLKLLLVGFLSINPSFVQSAESFTGSGKTVVSGDTLVYQILLHNSGTVDATDVVLTDKIPSEISYISGSLKVDGVSDPNAFISKNTVRYTKNTLSVGKAIALTFNVVVNQSSGEIVNSACVSSDGVETKTCSNQVFNPIVSLEKTNENANIQPPSTLTNMSPTVTGEALTETEQLPKDEKAFIEEFIEEQILPNVANPQSTQITINGRSPDLAINDSTPLIEGIAAPGEFELINIDGRVRGVAISDKNGRYGFSVDESLFDGRHAVAIFQDGVQIDEASFEIDTKAPEPPADIDVDLLGVDQGPNDDDARVTLSISGRSDSDTEVVRMRINGEGGTILVFQPQAERWNRNIAVILKPGDHNVLARAFDSAGNASGATQTEFKVPSARRDALEQIVSIIADAFDNPSAETAAEITALVIIVLAILNLLTAASVGALLNFIGLIFSQPLLIFSNQRREAYGTVFNSLTKLPVDLAVVRLRDGATNRILHTKVTDKLGRYAFSVTQGNYAVEVVKPGYVFPTQFMQTSEDVAFKDILLGKTFSPDTPTRVIKNLPVDPIQDTRTPDKVKINKYMRDFQQDLALIVLLISFVTFIVAPTIIVASFVIIQFVVFGLFRRLVYIPKLKPFGLVRDNKTGKLVRDVVVRLFEPVNNKLIETQVATSGRYAFRVGQSKFYVSATKPGYETLQTETIDLTAVEKGAVIARDIALNRTTTFSSVPEVPIAPPPPPPPRLPQKPPPPPPTRPTQPMVKPPQQITTTPPPTSLPTEPSSEPFQLQPPTEDRPMQIPRKPASPHE